MKKPTGRPRGRPRRPPSEYGDALVKKDPLTQRPVESDKPGKRIGLTLRLHPADWLKLKNLAARLTIEHSRPVSVHELVHAATMRLLRERAQGFDLKAETLLEAETKATDAGDGVTGEP
jgi:hypothetical protein